MSMLLVRDRRRTDSAGARGELRGVVLGSWFPDIARYSIGTRCHCVFAGWARHASLAAMRYDTL